MRRQGFIFSGHQIFKFVLALKPPLLYYYQIIRLKETVTHIIKQKVLKIESAVDFAEHI